MAGNDMAGSWEETLGGFDEQTRGEGAPAIRWKALLPFLLVLPLFGESFHYVKALRPLWALSKAFPVLSLPLILYIFRHELPKLTRQFMLSLLYLFLVPSLTGIFSFQQDFFTGLTAQVKLLPLLYFFSFFALLHLLKLTEKEIEIAFLICAAITLILLIAFWLFVPQRIYLLPTAFDSAPMFTNDNRGNRIRMPMYFGLVGIFYWYRRFLKELRTRWFLLSAAGVASVIGIVRMRAMVLAVVGVILLNALRAAKPGLRLALLAASPLLLLLLFNIPYVASVFSTSQSSGFDVRAGTIHASVDFLGPSVVNWLIGVGTITPLDPTGLNIYFNHFFYLADITWLGIVFEYGIVGALLIAALPLRGIWMSRKIHARSEFVFLGSLQDFLIYVILVSPLFPATLAPGEYAIILAIFVYMHSLHQKEAEQFV